MVCFTVYLQYSKNIAYRHTDRVDSYACPNTRSSPEMELIFRLQGNQNRSKRCTKINSVLNRYICSIFDGLTYHRQKQYHPCRKVSYRGQKIKFFPRFSYFLNGLGLPPLPPIVSVPKKIDFFQEVNAPCGLIIHISHLLIASQIFLHAYAMLSLSKILQQIAPELYQYKQQKRFFLYQRRKFYYFSSGPKIGMLLMSEIADHRLKLYARL